MDEDDSPDANEVKKIKEEISKAKDGFSEDSTQSSTSTYSESVSPDEATVERIKNLAQVGNAIFLTGDDVGFQTAFFAGKEALSKFADGINKLNLSGETKEGMDNLIKYLQKKLDRRIKNFEKQNEKPTI